MGLRYQPNSVNMELQLQSWDVASKSLMLLFLLFGLLESRYPSKEYIYIYIFSSGFVFFTMIIAHFVPACMFALFFFLVLAFHLLYGSFDLLCQFIFLLLNCLGSDYTIFFFSIFRVYLPMLLWELMVGSTAGKILLGGTIGMRFEPGSHE